MPRHIHHLLRSLLLVNPQYPVGDQPYTLGHLPRKGQPQGQGLFLEGDLRLEQDPHPEGDHHVRSLPHTLP